jgi:hypothetical protein
VVPIVLADFTQVCGSRFAGFRQLPLQALALFRSFQDAYNVAGMLLAADLGGVK